MYYGKVEISGIDTSKLKVLNEEVDGEKDYIIMHAYIYKAIIINFLHFLLICDIL